MVACLIPCELQWYAGHQPCIKSLLIGTVSVHDSPVSVAEEVAGAGDVANREVEVLLVWLAHTAGYCVRTVSTVGVVVYPTMLVIVACNTNLKEQSFIV